MKFLLTLLLLAGPLAAQHIAASNQSDKVPLNPMAAWEETVAVIKQAEGLHDALSSGDYDFDISAAACIPIRNQQRSGKPPSLPGNLIALPGNTAACEVLLTEDYVKEALHGWQAVHWTNPSGSDATVCASGCDYTDLETAVAAALCGETVTVTANETVNLTTNEIDIAKHCSQANPLWIRTSAYANAVFTNGSRVGTGDTSLMPRFTVSPNAAAFQFGPELLSFSSVNTGTDTLTTSSVHGLAVGDKVFFTSDAPQPLDDTRPYWVLTVPTTTTFTVSRYENAAAATLDITGTASGSLVLPTQWVRLTGFSLGKNTGSHSGGLIEMGGQYHPDARTNHLWLDHIHTDGLFNEFQRRSIQLSGRWLSVTDSYLTGATDNADSQAIWVEGNGDGPIWLENNYTEATGENIYWGGAVGDNLHLNPGDFGTFVVKGNWMYKPTSWKITSVAGSPTTPCVPGEWWEDTTGAPDCSICDAGGASWTLQGSCTNAPLSTFSSKNNFEFKKISSGLNLGNIYENSWADAGSQNGTLLSLKQSPASQNGPNAASNNSLFYGEIARRGGMLAKVAGVDTATSTGIPGNIVFWNLLAYDIDLDLYDYITDAPDSFFALQSTGLGPDGFEMRHVTLAPSHDSTTDNRRWFGNENSYSGLLTQSIRVHDSVLSFSDVKTSGRTAGCPSIDYFATLDVGTNLVVWSDGAGPNMSACSTAFYSETAMNNVGFADWANDDYRITSSGTGGDYRAGGAQDASDGKDLGADIDIVKDLTGGVEAGLLSWSEQYGVAVTAAGSTTATVEWDRPNAANACNFYLYTDYARTSEHADTAGDNGDNRDGGVSAGHVTFTLGDNAVLTTKTWYWFEIDCATDSVKMVGSLFTN